MAPATAPMTIPAIAASLKSSSPLSSSLLPSSSSSGGSIAGVSDGGDGTTPTLVENKNQNRQIRINKASTIYSALSLKKGKKWQAISIATYDVGGEEIVDAGGGDGGSDGVPVDEGGEGGTSTTGGWKDESEGGGNGVSSGAGTSMAGGGVLVSSGGWAMTTVVAETNRISSKTMVLGTPTASKIAIPAHPWSGKASSG